MTTLNTYDENVYDGGSVTADVTASGTLRAVGQFTYLTPEPATLVLLLAGAALLRARRR